MRNVFYRASSALARFMYGRNGSDQLNVALLAVYLVVCLLRALFVRSAAAAAFFNILTLLAAALLLFRMFSRASAVWTGSTNTSPAKAARPSAACRRARERLRSPVPSAERRSSARAEGSTGAYAGVFRRRTALENRYILRGRRSERDALLSVRRPSLRRRRRGETGKMGKTGGGPDNLPVFAGNMPWYPLTSPVPVIYNTEEV